MTPIWLKKTVAPATIRPGIRSATHYSLTHLLAPALTSLLRRGVTLTSRPGPYTLAARVALSILHGGSIRKQSLTHLFALAVGSLVTVVFTVSRVRPIFVQREPVVAEILRHEYVDSAALRAPWLNSPANLALQTPQFLADRERFMRDLLRTGKVDQSRAWRLADVAVSEAYRRRLPPALVLGVMLTENDELKSTARSSVGAVGLMQIHGSSWRRALGRLFGTNLRNDTTNLRYGIYILGYMARRASDKVATDSAAADTLVGSDSSWRMALLHYNGCVRGTNTPNCRSYPVTVRRNVIDNAKTTCNGQDFEACVARPLWLSTRQQH